VEKIRLSGLHYRVLLLAFVKHLFNIPTAFATNITYACTLVKLATGTNAILNRLFDLFIRDCFANAYIHDETPLKYFC
jgi:hypothetical protein